MPSWAECPRPRTRSRHHSEDAQNALQNRHSMGNVFANSSPSPSPPLSSPSTPSDSMSGASFITTDSLVSGTPSCPWNASDLVGNSMIRNDRLLTDTSTIFPMDLKLTPTLRPMVHPSDVMGGYTYPEGQPIKREPGISSRNRPTMGSDGDSLPESPLSLSEDMETDCYHPFITFNTSMTSQTGPIVTSAMTSLDTSEMISSFVPIIKAETSDQPIDLHLSQSISISTPTSTMMSPTIAFMDDLSKCEGEEDVLEDKSDEDEDDDDEDDDDEEDEVMSKPVPIRTQCNNIPVQNANGNNIGYIIKQEQPVSPVKICTPPSLLKSSSTIVLTTTNANGSSSRFVIPKVNIKVNPHGAISSSATTLSLSQGIVNASIPGGGTTSSPVRISTSTVNGTQVTASSSLSSTVTTSPARPRNVYGHSTRQPIQTPLISSQPKGSTGPLLLTEEEKRTLLSEGYHVPQRLPLTKQEEKSLKKIRRKIKNKISAQESRRKKKEYMDCLERKMDSLHAELSQYKAKCVTLEGQNSNLVAQVKRLQTQLTSRNGAKAKN
ncbi:cyclic AMP response element-binding protein A-like isoform X2 [Tigriopus californicus]|uniref:cyclic AMP response element-binding protein A-like isoform X2 n=1 Tax=Tigriopus californicus TaxID=6832 RepID=UPI0027DAA47F|nr:cyclic AMP response element-binding protein A-like isoform X2 [Tigriopus californicus]